MLTVAEMANELNVTTRTIRNYLAEGKLEGVKVGGQWRFEKKELYKFLGVNDDNHMMDLLDETKKAAELFGLLVLSIPVYDLEEMDCLKNSIIEQYNLVYEGENRRLLYTLESKENATLTLQGPPEYLISFGEWITKKTKEFRGV